VTEQQTSTSDLQRFALESYRDEYRDLSEIWRNLDAKAQGLSAIAGVFLAAVLAWSRALPAEFGKHERFLIAGTIVLLFVAIVAAVCALQLRKVKKAPFGDETAGMVRDILPTMSPEDFSSRASNFYNDQMTAWKDTNRDIREKIQSKTSWLTFAQYTLLLTAFLAAVVAMFPILGTFCQ
jgi:hypothetical protein